MKTSKNKALLVGVSIALGLGGLSSAQVTGERLFTNTQPKVSRQQAEMKASKAYPAVKIKDVEIENENGRLLYSVEFVDDAEVELDAHTGEIVKVEHPDPSDETEGVETKDDD